MGEANEFEVELYEAIGSNDLVTVKNMLQSDRVNPNKEYDYDFAIHRAAREGKTAIVEELLNSGKVDPNIANPMGLTALHWAAEHNHAEVVEVLLKDKTVNPNPRDNQGGLPLNWAAGCGNNVESIKALLSDERIDPNAVTTHGRTALHDALSKPIFLESAKALLQSGKIHLSASQYADLEKGDIANILLNQTIDVADSTLETDQQLSGDLNVDDMA